MVSSSCLMTVLREQKGWRQLDLARLVGTTESMISRIETGRCLPKEELALLLEKYLGRSISDLLKPYKNPQRSLFDHFEADSTNEELSEVEE